MITEEALQFRSAKLLGHEVETLINWENIDTIKKVGSAGMRAMVKTFM